MRITLAAATFTITCLLPACKQVPQIIPRLQLSPASLGQPLSLQQQIEVTGTNQHHSLNAVLEVDTQHLTIVGMALGQRVLTLRFDGQQLQEQRHPLLPAQVQGSEILNDLQLALWPADAIRPHLPSGWHLDDSTSQRVLYQDNQRITEINYTAQPAWLGLIEIRNLRYEYRLTIRSAPMDN
ncbi:DUF3261 domain-containing protein [Chitinivorax sp. B]|uniref:DUF3261 domain-containing protein n=1 Tax=Chitinivorax sp. B TaxID=2502235 RepID=UPI0010F5D29C|nr:DUF3261 domain-containing protein [Chitinivorax sp. B]